MASPHPPSLHLSLRQLEIFRAVAESGSIRSAARHVHLTQPAVTHAMRELERSVGAQLFTRSVKGVALTEIGAALLRRSHRLFNELRRTEDEIAQLRDGTGGQLAVAFSSAAAQLLPAALADFRRRRPGVALELQEITWPDLDDRWRRGGYDFAVVSEWGDAGEDGLQREPLLEQPLSVVARASHPLAKARSLAALQQGLWVLPGYGQALLQQLFAARRMAPPADVITCQSTQVALALLQRMDAFALMSDGLLLGGPGGARQIVPLPLPGTPLARLRITLLLRDAEAQTPAARLFADCLRRAAKSAVGEGAPKAAAPQQRRR